MAVVVREVTESNAWEAFLRAHSEANFLQSWAWGSFHEALGKTVRRLGLYDGDQLVGVMLGVVEDAKRGRYLAVAGGPILDWQSKAQVAAWHQALRQVAREERCVFVRVRPQLVSTPQSLKQFKDLGFRPAPMHLSAELTSQLDITRSEEELLAGMRKTTRYEVRRAQKEGITIQTSTKLDDLQPFYDLQMETAARQRFVPFSYRFLATQFEAFSRDNNVVLYTATLDGKVLAQAFVIFYGSEAAYHYGASTELGRKHPGAYLIQWEAIKEAQRRGMARYNFWGIAPPDQTQHRFYGVTVFKRGFGGDDVEYVPAHDLVLNWPRYALNWLVEYSRKKLRKL